MAKKKVFMYLDEWTAANLAEFITELGFCYSDIGFDEHQELIDTIQENLVEEF